MITRVLISLIWAATGLLVAIGYIPLRVRGVVFESTGKGWFYYRLAAGMLLIAVGLLYFFHGRTRDYLDNEAEKMNLLKGRYRMFGWYNILRFWK